MTVLKTMKSSAGLTDRPKPERKRDESDVISKVSLDACPDILTAVSKSEPIREIPDVPAKEKYNAERRTLQILEVLRILTDEDHSISKDELGRMLRLNMLRYNRLREKHGIADKGFHNVHLFVGAPGTAKTTVAKMMTEMMRSEKLLKGDRFISITGTQLKGEYVGQTAPKVHALFQEYDAIFIDEAYSLTCGGHSGMDVYSREALAQLAVELEDHATDKLVIFAGYGGTEVSEKNNLMKEFLQSNPGISSRINSTIFFNSYSPKEMVEIVHRLAKLSSLQLGKTADHEIEAYFALRQHEEDFGNGREARVFLEKCQRFVAERVAGMNPDDVSESDLNSITAKDIRLAIEELKKEQVYRAGKERSGRIRIGYAV